MIISENGKKSNEEFEQLLFRSNKAIEAQAKHDPDYFITRTAIEFEEDVFDSLCDEALNTDFHNTIQLISGHKFPDITVDIFGVEVKTTKQNHWKTIGNSVFETTRVENIERIYLYFAQLHNPPVFKYRLYQDCLYDIAVTHSPRYLINMQLDREASIFAKRGIEYDQLRQESNPIRRFVDYYRKNAKPGEEPWWMDSPDAHVKPTVTLWGN